MGSSSKGGSSSSQSLPPVGADISAQPGYTPGWAAGSGAPVAQAAPPASSSASFDAAGFAQSLAGAGSPTPSNIPNVDITPSQVPGSYGVQNFGPLPFKTTPDLRKGADFKKAAGKTSNTDMVTQFLAALQGKGDSS